MEWYRTVCAIDDLKAREFFEGIDQLSAGRRYGAGSAGWLGKWFPTPFDMEVWLRFEPRLPVHLEILVALFGFEAVAAPREANFSIVWSELFAIPSKKMGASPVLPAFQRSERNVTA
jgi:hypothetical protein